MYMYLHAVTMNTAQATKTLSRVARDKQMLFRMSL